MREWEIHDLHLVKTGGVHSPIRSQKEMPSSSVDGEIELFSLYADALEGIEGHSELFFIRLDAQG